MKPTEALQKKLYDEMVARIQQTDETAPYRRGEWLYWSKTTEGKQYPTLLRRRVSGGDPEVLLDLNAMAAGHGFFALGGVNVSDDGNLLAYSIDTTGYRQYLLQVKDLRTGATSSDRVPRVGSIVWARDNHTLFLTTEDSVTKRSDKFWRHKVGTDSIALSYTAEKYSYYMLSMSPITNVQNGWLLDASTSACCSRSERSVRFGSPVRPSYIACLRSRSSRARRSPMSRAMTDAPMCSPRSPTSGDIVSDTCTRLPDLVRCTVSKPRTSSPSPAEDRILGDSWSSQG